MIGFSLFLIKPMYFSKQNGSFKAEDDLGVLIYLFKLPIVKPKHMLNVVTNYCISMKFHK